MTEVVERSLPSLLQMTPTERLMAPTIRPLTATSIMKINFTSGTKLLSFEYLTRADVQFHIEWLVHKVGI